MKQIIFMIKTKIVVYVMFLVYFINLSDQNELISKYRNLSGTYSDSIKAWVSSERNPNQKWCKNVNNYSSGFIWHASDISLNCDNNQDIVWSNDATKFIENSMKLLCPLSYSYWNTQSYIIFEIFLVL